MGYSGGGGGEPDNVTLGTNVSGKLEIKDEGVDTVQLKDDSVTTDKIIDEAVTAAKLAAGLGAMRGLGSVTLGAPAQNMQVAGINGNNFFELQGSCILDNIDAGQIDIKLLVNGDIVDTNYYIQRNIFSGATLTPARVNTPDVCVIGTTSALYLKFAIRRDFDGIPKGIVQIARDASSAIKYFSVAWGKTASVAEITSVQIRSDVAASINTGSELKIWGLV